jgi:hypothetical protein
MSKADKPKNTRRPSVRFAESNHTIFSIDDDQEQDQVEESDLGGSRSGRGKAGHRVEVSADNAASTADNALATNVTTAQGQEEQGEEALTKNKTDHQFRSVYGLKSTQSSREAEFEADDSDVEADELDPVLSSASAHVEDNMQRTGPRSLSLMDRIPTLPLVVDRARQSISEGAGHNLRESLRNAMESEEIPDWLRKGAGILDSTWNMSNSILGAGVVGKLHA